MLCAWWRINRYQFYSLCLFDPIGARSHNLLHHYTTNAVHFRRRKALDANVYFKLKCQMLQHKPQDIINISHLNLKNVLRWTQMRLMKLIQAGLHKQKKCVDNASPAMSLDFKENNDKNVYYI